MNAHSWWCLGGPLCLCGDPSVYARPHVTPHGGPDVTISAETRLSSGTWRPRTPPAFAEWLLDLAAQARRP